MRRPCCIEQTFVVRLTSKNKYNETAMLYRTDMRSKVDITINREYYMALSVSHPVSTRDTNIIPRALTRGLIRDVIRKEPYHIMFIIYLNMRKSCSVL